MSNQPAAFRARWVFPVRGAPIADGVVRIEGAKFAAVGGTGGGNVEDLGNVAIVPGLVNAHTHLEFGRLTEPLGTPGMSLPEWIRLVLAERRTAGNLGTAAVAAGLRESLAAGTTALGEIATEDWRSSGDLPPALPTTVLFHEFIGPTLARAQTAAAAAEAFLRTHSPRPDVLPGLSPHAPYTVHPHLLAELVELSQRYRVAVAMHLAETREELELLNLEAGPFRELLEEVGAWDPAEDARLACPLDYLGELAKAPRALVVHGNYLDGEEIEFVAANRQTMSVVYCPRTHAFFGHEPYPLAEMLTAGVNVALGTDSRASNPNLNVLEEVKHAAEAHPGVARGRLLEMATLGGAKALGLDETQGTLEPGKRADFAVIALGERDAADAHDLLMAPEARIVGTYIGGRRIQTPTAGSS
jgi:cytosine/adenosine deaminase-related metal-dependent hydrolase